MAINEPYLSAQDLPQVIPLFPLSGALLLPRAEMPLNIFEPRYMRMIDDAIAGTRVIGMVQPAAGTDDDDVPVLSRTGCAGRITALQESGDGRYLITLTGVARFDIMEETTLDTPYRMARVDSSGYGIDFATPKGDAGVDRPRLLKTLEAYLKANNLDADWEGIDETSSELLVNMLAMMSPYGPREKQALLEAPTVRERSEMLIAITERTLLDEGPGETLQ